MYVCTYVFFIAKNFSLHFAKCNLSGLKFFVGEVRASHEQRGPGTIRSCTLTRQRHRPGLLQSLTLYGKHILWGCWLRVGWFLALQQLLAQDVIEEDPDQRHSPQEL